MTLSGWLQRAAVDALDFQGPVRVVTAHMAVAGASPGWRDAVAGVLWMGLQVGGVGVGNAARDGGLLPKQPLVEFQIHAGLQDLTVLGQGRCRQEQRPDEGAGPCERVDDGVFR